MKDSFSRVIDYLRISITDKCNLRCIYCMPSEGVAPAEHTDILSYEEIIRVATIAAGLGVRKIRLTGGEPLVRKNLVFLVSELKKISGIEDLSLTTNGLLLAHHAASLAHAGLDRVNVSIDSLRPERFREITRGGDLDVVLKGLQAAEQAGLLPIKVNMVPVRGMNEDEILDFARITIDSDHQVRFIECMPTGSVNFWSPQKYMTTDEIKKIIETLGPLSPVRVRKNGPSKYYRLKGAKGVIGFISALTHHFCKDCNRLRLTSDGKLRPCLFSETEIDLRSALRSGASDEEIARLLRLSIEVKPKEHQLNGKGPVDAIVPDHSSLVTHHSKKRPMSRIGG
ncbi:MAG: GTP 3',8-cyclase MoaA [Nitrospirae bacterium]|nr:GTP 3',8-cyclase MoaA [Nitrospirota bacterium]